MNVIGSPEEVKELAVKFWQFVGTNINPEKLTITLTSNEVFHGLRALGITSTNLFRDEIVMPFADVIEVGGEQDKYLVYLEEVRAFLRTGEGLDSPDVPDTTTLVIQIGHLKQGLRNLYALRAKRKARAWYKSGLKPELVVLSKNELQDELEELFGIRDTNDFKKALSENSITEAEGWLNHIIENKDRYYYYLDTLVSWSRDRRSELTAAKERIISK